MEGIIATAMARSTPVYWPLAFRSYCNCLEAEIVPYRLLSRKSTFATNGQFLLARPESADQISNANARIMGDDYDVLRKLGVETGHKAIAVCNQVCDDER